MHLLPCPCGHRIAIAPSQAGGTTRCPACEREISVPLLRELRRLPPADERDAATAAPQRSTAARVAFSLLLGIAVVTGGAAIGSLVRWQTIPVPYTMEEHLRDSHEYFKQAPPAELVGWWSALEQQALTHRHPPFYLQEAQRRSWWRRATLITGTLALLGAAAAWALLRFSDPRRSPDAPTARR
jgi:hypothetical protein